MTTTAPPVATESGTLTGIRSHGVDRYLGIPYAQVPLGGRRFRAPQLAPAWNGQRAAVNSGAAAPQPGSVRSTLLQGVVNGQSEDALWLNLWVPAGAHDAMPILVWIHGGAFTNGSAGAVSIDGAHLAAATNALVVTVNYRLGALGFALHPDLNDESVSPGLLDLFCAVEWVRRNGQAFGGDTEKLFVGGESAGSISAALLGLSANLRPHLAGLMLFSGFQQSQSRKKTEAATEHLATTLGIRVGDLPNIPAQELVRATSLSAAAGHRFWPTIANSAVLTAHPGGRRPYPVLMSTAAREGSFFLLEREGPQPSVSARAAQDMVDRLYPGSIERSSIENPAAGHPKDSVETAVRAVQHRIIDEPADVMRREFVTNGHPVYTVRQRTGSPLWGGWLGATHTLEIPLLFGTWTHPLLQRLYDPITAEPSATELQALCARFFHGCMTADDLSIEIGAPTVSNGHNMILSETAKSDDSGAATP
ncbi:carboxylesterase family protein (plasmid) [Rhodococcus sp. USK10]|uniref:carboxylesterase family protein n=1 Tax=Rhodococcus sp. USK10 TaxID=2789739 RepID=UPI001C5E8955|nr:carboxylesterase family protein [Rhodococcus sp. USK10]QYB00242.1 carboxylesterase family protein [Rhodococcus sp. USK10]